MTSTIERSTPIELSSERARVRSLPNGSRLRLTGAVWLAWLEHIHRCQTDGLGAMTQRCTRHRGQVTALEAAYPQWDCCPVHKKLKAERRRLLDYVRDSGLHQPAPHQSDEPLSAPWWLERGYRFDVRVPIIVDVKPSQSESDVSGKG
jgi:hypothetical protein